MPIPNLSLPSFSACKADAFLIFWNLGSIATFVVPLLIFTISKNTYYYYDERGDQNQQEQEPQGYYDQYGNWIQYQQKHWWQFWKNDNYRGQEEQRSQDDQFQVPWWYIWGGEREPEEEGQGTVTFVYIYIVLMFLAVVIYGNTTMAQSSVPPSKLQFLMLGFANLCFLVCVLLGGLDGVKTEGREIEETGFYGQKSVLLFLTCVFGMFYSIISMIWIGNRIKNSSASEAQGEDDYQLHATESEKELNSKSPQSAAMV